MSRHSEKLDSRIVCDGYFQPKEVTFRRTRFDSTMSDPIKRVVLEVGEVVAALILKPAERKVVLIEQFRFPATLNDEGWLTEVVAGRVDPGETLEQAFRREVLEEVGYEIHNIRPVHRFYPAAGTVMEHMTVFAAEAGRRANPGGGTDADEDIRVLEWSYDDLFAALDAGKIIDAKTIVAAQWLRLNAA